MWEASVCVCAQKKEATITPMCESESLHPEAHGKK